MDDKKLNNDNIENISSNMQNYNIEIPDKKNFFESLLDKLKSNKNQKLLDSSNHIKTTNRSISSLWGFGNFRTSLFNTLDTVRKAIFDRFSSEPQKNTLAVEIIGNDSSKENEISKESDKTLVNPIMPITQQQKNTSQKNNHKIEVTTIDTSAIDEKNIDKESNENKTTEVLPEIETSISPENISNKKLESNKTDSYLDER